MIVRMVGVSESDSEGDSEVMRMIVRVAVVMSDSDGECQ